MILCSKWLEMSKITLEEKIIWPIWSKIFYPKMTLFVGLHRPYFLSAFSEFVLHTELHRG